MVPEKSRRYQGYDLVISVLRCGTTTVTLTEFIGILQRKMAQGLGPVLGLFVWGVSDVFPAQPLLSAQLIFIIYNLSLQFSLCIHNSSLLWSKPHGTAGRILLFVTGL